jgi:predicted NAD-dependent protein-ADP-ribosyltransferase YbiA (DUF1768 family)
MTTPTISSDPSLGPVYFWREFEQPFGFLSQWYESAFEVDGVTYVSAEMWMMIQKARLFGDEVRWVILVYKSSADSISGDSQADDADDHSQRASSTWS